MPPPLGSSQFARWLESYGNAWESRDPQAAALLFTDDAEYFWTPFEPPKRGPGGIAGAWSAATSRQRDVHFTFEILAVAGEVGIARWHTRLVRVPSDEPVELDGVLAATFDSSGTRCRVFREWWHSTESA